MALENIIMAMVKDGRADRQVSHLCCNGKYLRNKCKYEATFVIVMSIAIVNIFFVKTMILD